MGVIPRIGLRKPSSIWETPETGTPLLPCLMPPNPRSTVVLSPEFPSADLEGLLRLSPSGPGSFLKGVYSLTSLSTPNSS